MSESNIDGNVVKSVMMEAEGLVNGARAQAYGHPKENFDRICWLWNAYLRGRADFAGNDLTPKDHAIMMILVKIARLQETPNHRDSLVDICGYAGTYEKLIAREEQDNAEIEAAYEALAAALVRDTQESVQVSGAVETVPDLCDGIDGNPTPCQDKNCSRREPGELGERCLPPGIAYVWTPMRDLT